MNALSVVVNAAKRTRGNGYIAHLMTSVAPFTVDNQPKDTGRHPAPQQLESREHGAQAVLKTVPLRKR